MDDFVAMLLEGAKERKDSVVDLVGSYSENPRISLHGLAAALKRSIFEVIPLLVSHSSFIHASRPPENMQAAREALQQKREIVVEVTSISTLAMLEAVP